MTKPDRPHPGPEEIDAVIDRLYEVAVDPLRLESLLDHWEAMIAPHRAGIGGEPMLRLGAIEGHFARADRVLRDVNPTAPASAVPDDPAAAVGRLGRAAGLALDRAGRVIAANEAATATLGLRAGDDVVALPLAPGEAEVIRAEAARLIAANGTEPSLLRVRAAQSDRVMLLHLQVVRGADAPAHVVAVASELGWPEGFSRMLRGAFDLTPAEVEVMRALAEGSAAADVAAARGRSVDTVRVQIKSLLAKTGTRSQVELVRLTLSTMEIAQFTGSTAEAGSAPPATGTGTLPPVPMRTMRQADGRRYDYVVLGDPDGAPVCYMPTDLGLIRWPRAAEAEARRRGIAIVVPIRAGYGRSDPLPDRTDINTGSCEDVLALWDHLGIDRMPIVTQIDDSFYAYRIHAMAPDRVPALVCCAARLPLTRPDQYERMDKWHRFILAGARYTPHLLPFMAKAGFALAHRLGKRGFVTAVYGKSDADMALMEDPEVFEAMTVGSEVALSADHSAHAAFAAGVIGYENGDWSGDLEALRLAVAEGKTVAHFLYGPDDPLVAPKTLEEFRADYPWIDFRVHEDAGQLILFARWREVIALIEPHLDKKRLPTQSGV